MPKYRRQQKSKDTFIQNLRELTIFNTDKM